MPVVRNRQIEPYDILLGHEGRRSFSIIVYEEVIIGDKKWLRPCYYFSTGPNFEITLKDDRVVISPSEFRKTDKKYVVEYNEEEKRFQLRDKVTGRVIQKIDFQLNEGYLESDLEVMGSVESSSPAEVFTTEIALRDKLTAFVRENGENFYIIMLDVDNYSFNVRTPLHGDRAPEIMDSMDTVIDFSLPRIPCFVGRIDSSDEYIIVIPSQGISREGIEELVKEIMANIRNKRDWPRADGITLPLTASGIIISNVSFAQIQRIFNKRFEIISKAKHVYGRDRVTIVPEDFVTSSSSPVREAENSKEDNSFLGANSGSPQPLFIEGGLSLMNDMYYESPMVKVLP